MTAAEDLLCWNLSLVMIVAVDDVKAVVMKALNGYVTDCARQPMKLVGIARDWLNDAVRCDDDGAETTASVAGFETHWKRL